MKRRGILLEFGVWIIFVAAGALMVRPLQAALFDNTKDAFEGLQTVIVAVGSALIGATAILASFVLFAMQVNVERLPHGLFRRFSSDARLLGTFLASFAFAIGGTALSLIQDRGFVAAMVLLGIAAAATVLRLLFAAFQRSLLLVNPIEQLQILLVSADRQARTFERRLSWIMPVLEQGQSSTQAGTDEEPKEIQVDTVRFAILQANAGWSRTLRVTVGYASAYARRAGEDGHTEASAAALSTLIGLNRIYVRVKGRTFHANAPLFDNPLVTDAFINGSLEELRRLLEAALARKDEQQAEQIFRTFLSLVQVYSEIQYPGVAPSKSHALLAAGYLERSVQAAVPLGLVDTAMAGLRTLGDAARNFLMFGDAAEMGSMVKTIRTIAAAGTLREAFRPLTLAAMEQLNDLTINLLRTKSTEIRFAASELRESVQLVARLFLAVPDTPLQSTHSFYLGPYFSSTSLTSFQSKLTELVNALLDAKPDNEAAQVITDNISEWADELYRGQKELLQLAIEKKSHFTFDLIHWTTTISELLLVAANSPATREHTRSELKKHASWLFSTLSWIPRDKETASWVENFSFTETIFEFALMSAARKFEEGYEGAWKLLFSWGVEAGRHVTGWGTLEQSLLALATLALRPGQDRADILREQLQAALAKPGAPSQELRDRAALDLREKANELGDNPYELRTVNRVLATNDRKLAKKLLRDLANILSPQATSKASGLR